MTEKFYITTAIDYVNAEPHIGHAYQKIIADALARWNRLIGKEVLFVTGTDEHGKKVEEAARTTGKKPKEFVDEISKKFKEAWKLLNIEPDRFIRTTDKDHEKTVIDFIKSCDKAGDIYKGIYEGLYCTGCEIFYTEQECPEKICQIHKKPLEQLKEDTYFFRLSKYKNFLLDLYEKHPEFIQPKSRRNEIINRVKKGLKDLSITRTSFDWGISFPLDKGHVTYVWFDALINYYTATLEKGRAKFWGEPTIHILGKDNTWFHTVYWPSMLKSAKIDLPKITLNHGFLTFNGQKISKSLGNAISLKTLVEKYGSDSVRYFCLRHFSFTSGSDGDFDESALIQRHNDELANKLGNLVSRVSTLAEKYGIEKTEDKSYLDKKTINLIDEGKAELGRDIGWAESEKEERSLLSPLEISKKTEREDRSLIFEKPSNEALEAIQRITERLVNNYELDKALNKIFYFIDFCNWYVQTKKPWETKDKKVLYELTKAIREIAKLLSPFIPETAEKILKIFKTDKIKKAPILFKKIQCKA